MKILFINDYKRNGGAEQVIDILIKNLNNIYKIDFFYGNVEYKTPENIFEYIYSKKFKLQLENKLEIFQPDIIHIHNYYHLLSPSILTAIKNYKKMNSNLKVIMTCHDFHILSPSSGFTFFSWLNNKIYRLERNPNLIDLLFKKWDQRGIKYSIAKQLQWIFNYIIYNNTCVIDKIISPSEFLASFLREKFSDKVEVVRNPLSSYINVSIHKLTNKHKCIKLLFVGRITAEKGLIEFINKLSEIKNIKYNFTIIGDGPMLNKLKILVNTLHLESKIIFSGYLKHFEVIKIMSNYDILVLTSILYENAPLSLVEGSLNNLKLLTMDYGGMKEIAKIAGNYFLLKDDLSNLNEGLISLCKTTYIKNKNLYDLFSMDNYLMKIKRIYNEN
jgi:glycosyltransferase involved in cell wall biosynthesis